MSRILVSGSLAYDRIMDFPGYFRDHFLPDKLHNINISFGVETFAENFGGTAGNIAYNLALLGLQPKIISTAGSDFDRYARHLQALNVDLSSVHVDMRALTSTAYVITDKSDNQIAAFSSDAGNEPYVPLPETEDCGCAVIGAGCVEDMRVLPEHYRSRNIPYLYDPGQQIPALSDEDLRRGISNAAVVFGNDYEMGLMMQKTGWDEKTLLDKTQVIISTYGEKGSRILTRTGEAFVKSVRARDAIDPTGAGDAYRAGYLVGFTRGLPPDKCAQIGATTAVYAVEHYGTQNHVFTPADIKARYEETYKEPLVL